MILPLLRSPAAKWFAAPVLAALGYHEYELPAVPIPRGAGGAAVAAPSRGRSVSIEFTPQSGVQLNSGLAILNDRADYHDPATRTVVIDGARLPAGETVQSLRGRALKVQGHETTYKGKAQVRAESISVK